MTELYTTENTISMGKGLSMTFLRNAPYLARVHITADADLLQVPLHWHETHDEIFRVIQGQMKYTIGSTVKIYVPEDGVIHIPKGVVHAISSIQGVETIFEETTDPMDDEKELFFRNLFAPGVRLGNLLQIFPVFYHGDAIPALPGGFKWLDKVFAFIVGNYLSPLFGYRRTWSSLKKV
ncbi:hypothetical protein BJ138DRAFT_1140524 [Hygrophoropsis aurantiaca]|uniref:Uncharacterized protein n=1 Tax=Hygrophoropsis aurantiaca TaxID=72124 RepID=A0ACB8AS52_9AGAM|nr:hypothetical protein BJ138DRAFT_1140524 [Hygrophoropsis aurantiaca]